MGDSEAVAIEENWNISFGDFRLGDLIGKGSFGSVYKSRFSGIDVAVKHIRSVYGQAGEFDHEVAMLRGLRHPNIVLFMGVATNGDDLYLVQEWVSGGSLSRILMDKATELPWKTRVKMAMEIAAALLFLHKKKCLHRDLKCENVLIEANEDGSEGFGRCKLADFGLSTLFVRDGKPMSEVGTPWWRAPELSTHLYDFSADIFSFGIVLYEIILRAHGEDIRVAMTFEKKIPGQKLIFGVAPQMFREPNSEFYEAVKLCPKELLQLAEECCREDPQQRPTTEEVVDRLDALYKQCQQVHTYSMGILRMLESTAGDLRRSIPVVAAVESPARSPNQLPSIARQALRVWSNLAIANMTPDTDPAAQQVPFLQILSALEEKLEVTTSRKLDAKSQEFLGSVIEVLPHESIDITQFSKFWAWYYTTGRVIQHPGVRPLFRDGFIHGFISATTCTKLLVDNKKEDNFIIRFSSSKPGCLVITCFHASQLRHVLVSIDFFETLSMGCFLIGNQRCNTLKEVFTKNNLHFLRYVYPDVPIESPKFHAAFQEIDTELARELAMNQAGSRMSTDIYDDILDQTDLDGTLFPKLKNELAARQQHGTAIANLTQQHQAMGLKTNSAPTIWTSGTPQKPAEQQQQQQQQAPSSPQPKSNQSSSAADHYAPAL